MMRLLQLFLVLSSVVILAITSPFADALENNEHLVTKQLVAAKNPALCEESCRMDDNCEAFYILNPQESKVAAWPCYKLTKTMRTLVTTFPQAFFQSTKGCYGVKVHSASKKPDSSMKKTMHGEELRRRAVYLVDKQLVVTSKTLLTQSKQFIKGCSYSISLWVWIWNKTPKSQSFQAVFSSHETYPNVGNNRTLLPAIVYNVGQGRDKDKFFFSMARGRHSEDFLGIWAGKVKYQEWTHLAMTVEGNMMKLYQDGKFLDYLQLDFTVSTSTSKTSDGTEAEKRDDREIVQRCPVDNDHIMMTRCVEANATDNRKLEWGHLQKSLTPRIPNVVMWIGGSRKKEARMTGMLQDVLLFENTVLTAEDISLLIQDVRPATSHSSFNKLLEFYSEDHHAYGMCESRWHGNFYEMMAWRICPEEVCGEVCFTAAFLGQASLDAKVVSAMQTKLLMKGKNESSTAVDITEAQNGKNDKPTSVFIPDIGYIKPLDHRTIQMKHEKKASSLSLSIGKKMLKEAMKSLKLDYFIDVIEQQWDILQNKTLIKKSLEFLYEDNNNRTINNSTLLNAKIETDVVTARLQQWMMDHKQDGYYLQDREGKVQGLYKLAMSILQGQHAAQYFQAFNNSFSAWGSNATEMSQASLSLAAMMADEIFSNTAQNMEGDTAWNFEYYKHLSQPIFLALGNRMGIEGDIVAFSGKDVLKKLSEKGYTLPPIKAIKDCINTSFHHTVDSASSHEKILERIAQHSFPSFSSNNTSLFLDLLDKLIGENSVKSDHNNKAEIELSLSGKGVAWGKPLSGEASRKKQRASGLILSKSDNYLNFIRQKNVFDSFLSITGPKLQHALQHSTEAMDVINILKQGIEDDYFEAVYSESTSFVETENPTKGQANTLAAASYYFPIAQYVTAHYGISHAGVGVLEEVRLMVSKGKVQGYAGEDDSSHQLSEFDALAGDAEAQAWLGKKYFWGLGGLQRNEHMAREWFERAAAQNHPEGLYNLGCFYANGQGGVARDAPRAMEFFRRAANAEKPFFMAVNAVAQHYMSDKNERNYTLAKEYLLKAANMGSDDALFSLATIAREGLAGAVDIPLSVFYLSKASSNGHMRSLSFLSHGLYDANSWYSQFGREQLASLRNQVLLSALNRSTIQDEHSSSNQTNVSIKKESDFAFKNSSELWNNAIEFLTKKNGNAKLNKLSTKIPQQYNSSEPIHIVLRDGHVVKLPYPIGSSQISDGMQQHTDPEASLAILRYLSQMSYRTADLSHSALKAFIQEENKILAVKLFEEAADLGLASAQENSAFLFEKLREEICLNNSNSNTSNSDLDASSSCSQFFETLAMRRWLQLAKVGEPFALRKVAERILRNYQANGPHSISKSDSVTSMVSLSTTLNHSIDKPLAILQDFTVEHAVEFLAIAARMGSTESLVDLGWLIHDGVGNRTGNSSKAMEIFKIALQMETLGSYNILNSYLVQQRKESLGKFRNIHISSFFSYKLLNVP